MSAADKGTVQELDRQPDVAHSEQIVARQPIVGLDERIAGYGLLGRMTDQVGPESLTALDLLTGQPDGVERLVGGGFAVVRADARIAPEIPAARPNTKTVIQLRRGNAAGSDLIVGMRRLAALGHRTAIELADLESAGGGSGGAGGSDGAGGAGFGESIELAKLANILVVPAGSHADGHAELARIADRYRRPGLELLATGIDDASTAAAARAAGFSYRQGSAVPVPPGTSARSLDASRFGPMRLAASLLGGAFEVSELEDILRIEPVMTFQLLRLAGAGADSGMRREVRSIREALVLIGSTRLQSWLSLLMLRNASDDHVGAISMAIARARMCELLIRAESAKLAPLAFTAGILSSFDLLLGVDLDTMAAELPLEESLREAAFGYGNRVAQIRHDVTAFQRGRISEPRMSGLTDGQLDSASITAIRWAEAAAWTFSASPTAG